MPFTFDDLIKQPSEETRQIASIRKNVAGNLTKDEREILDRLLGTNIKTPDVLQADNTIKKPDMIEGINPDVLGAINTFISDTNVPGVKGIMLYGPPGTGKTELAKALSREKGMVLLEITEDILGGKLGEPVARLGIMRKVVEQYAEKGTKCMLLLDEADSIFKQRSAMRSDAAVNVTSAGVTNFLLRWFNDKTVNNLVVIGATNDISRMDNALMNRMAIKLEMNGMSDTQFVNYIKVEAEKVLENQGGFFNRGQRADGMTKRTLLESLLGRVVNGNHRNPSPSDYENLVKKVCEIRLNHLTVEKDELERAIRKNVNLYLASSDTAGLSRYMKMLSIAEYIYTPANIVQNLFGEIWKSTSSTIGERADKMVKKDPSCNIDDIVKKLTTISIIKYLAIIPNFVKDQNGLYDITSDPDNVMNTYRDLDVLTLVLVASNASPRAVNLALGVAKSIFTSPGITPQATIRQLNAYLWWGFGNSFGSAPPTGNSAALPRPRRPAKAPRSSGRHSRKTRKSVRLRRPGRRSSRKKTRKSAKRRGSPGRRSLRRALRPRKLAAF